MSEKPDHKKIDNIVHSYLGKIITTSGNFKYGIYQLKSSKNFHVITKTADRLIEASPAYHKYLYGQPLPGTISEISVSKQSPFCKELKAEVDWVLLSIRKYKAELSIFLNYKKEFENAFLIGDYESASKTLDYCIKDLGYSIWAINSRMLLHEYQTEPDKAKILLTTGPGKPGFPNTASSFL